MTDSRREETLDVLLAGWPAMLKHEGLPANSCVVSALLATAALRELGFDARATPCRVAVLNEAAVKMADEGHRPGDSEWTRGLAAGAWSHYVGIGLGGQSAPGDYDGHMVVVVDERDVADPTAHQFSRPDRGVTIEPLRFPVTPAFLAGEPTAVDADGAYVEYTVIPGETNWMPGMSAHFDGWDRDVRTIGAAIADALRARNDESRPE